MRFNFCFECESLEECVSLFSQLQTAFAGGTTTVVTPPTASATRPKKVRAEPAVEPDAETPKPVAAEKPKTNGKPDAEFPRKDILALAQRVIAKGKGPAINGLLKDFGVPTIAGLAEKDPADWAAFMVACENYLAEV